MSKKDKMISMLEEILVELKIMNKITKQKNCSHGAYSFAGGGGGFGGIGYFGPERKEATCNHCEAQILV